MFYSIDLHLVWNYKLGGNRQREPFLCQAVTSHEVGGGSKQLVGQVRFTAGVRFDSE